MSGKIIKHKILWKSMKAGLCPGRGNNMEWEIGRWYKHDGKLEMGKAGFQASERIVDSMRYVCLENLAQVEVRGNHIEHQSQQCWSQMRIKKAWKWEKEDSVELAIFAAELVLDVYEKKYPKDKRPRNAVRAAREYFENPNSISARAAAYTAYRAGYAAYTAHAAHTAAQVAHAAAYAAYTAYTSAHAAAYAAHVAAYVPRCAADAADAKILDQCEAWIKKRIKRLEKIF